MEKEILKYFNNIFSNNDIDTCLKVLDNKYKDFYTGVTLNYITYSLLKAKYKKNQVAKCLLKLHKEGKIRSLYCPNIKNYVFENKFSKHWNFERCTGSYIYNIYNLHDYLKNFIKDE